MPIEDLKATRISIAIHVVAGLLTGWASFAVGTAMGDLTAGLAGLAILFAVGYATRIGLKRTQLKWWLSNGAVLFLFFWLIGWVLLLNMG
jgi:hypothetical protein